MDVFGIMGYMFGFMGFLFALIALSKTTKLEKELNELKRTVEKLQTGK